MRSNLNSLLSRLPSSTSHVQKDVVYSEMDDDRTGLQSVDKTREVLKVDWIDPSHLE